MRSFPRWLILLLSALLFIAFTWYFSNIVSYLLIAGILSLIGQPLMEFIAGRKIKRVAVPRSVAALMTMTLMLLLTLLLLSIFIPLIIREANKIAAMDVAQLSAAFEQPVRSIEAFLKNAGLLKEESLHQYMQLKLKSFISFTSVSNILGTIVGVTGNVFLSFVSVSFILFFFLREKDLFYKIISALVPDEHEQKMDRAFHGVKRLLTRYFLGILFQVVILGVLLTIGLSIAGIKNALLIAFFGALLNIIPYLGVIIAVALGFILSVAEAFPIAPYPGMLMLALRVGLVFWLAQLIDNFIVQPLVFSSSVKAHPLEIFLVILAGGTAGGMFGMVLAVPAYTVVRVIAKEFFSEFKIVRELTAEM